MLILTNILLTLLSITKDGCMIRKWPAEHNRESHPKPKGVEVDLLGHCLEAKQVRWGRIIPPGPGLTVVNEENLCGSDVGWVRNQAQAWPGAYQGVLWRKLHTSFKIQGKCFDFCLLAVLFYNNLKEQIIEGLVFKSTKEPVFDTLRWVSDNL